jgi:hypothetical protein
MVDGDDTYPIEMATEMTRLLKNYDVVIGSRLKGTIEPGAMTKLNVVGNVLLSLLAWALFGTRISDVCTGFWAYRSDAIRRLELAAHGFEIEADMFAECARNGLRIAELPITYRARADQPKLSSLRDGVKIGLFLCRRRLEQVHENVTACVQLTCLTLTATTMSELTSETTVRQESCLLVMRLTMCITSQRSTAAGTAKLIRLL